MLQRSATVLYSLEMSSRFSLFYSRAWRIPIERRSGDLLGPERLVRSRIQPARRELPAFTVARDRSRRYPSHRYAHALGCPRLTRCNGLADVDSQDHIHLLGSTNLTLPASVVSRSSIRRVKQHQRTPLEMPRRDTGNTHMPKMENGQAAFFFRLAPATWQP